MRTLATIARVSEILGVKADRLRELAATAGKHYRSFDLRRNRGEGKWRHIDDPLDELKSIQRRILDRILTRAPLPETMHGGVRRRPTKGHAGGHVGKAVLVTLDLRDCFPSTAHERIYRVLAERVGCAPDVARILTQLTTLHGCVPQGAPSSPYLIDLSLMELHRELNDLARKHGLWMSMYVDDIAISGPEAEVVIDQAAKSVSRHGHSLGRGKICVMPRNQPQSLTGITVNAKVAAPAPARD